MKFKRTSLLERNQALSFSQGEGESAFTPREGSSSPGNENWKNGRRRLAKMEKLLPSVSTWYLPGGPLCHVGAVADCKATACSSTSIPTANEKATPSLTVDGVLEHLTAFKGGF